MKQCIIFIFLLLSTITSCSDYEAKYPYFIEYDRDKVQDIIAQNDKTILFFWTSLCKACQGNLDRNIVPYIKNRAENIGIVLVYIGEQKAIFDNPDILKDIKVFNKASFGGMDKIFINKECNALLNDYHDVNYVPLQILCDSEGNILNCDKTQESVHYGNIINYL